MAKAHDIVASITEHNNIYRDKNKSNKERINALWEIGDILYQYKIKNPHTLGWEIQKVTSGLIKRPTIFRSHKIRTIWKDQTEFLRLFEKISGISNLMELIPLVDPDQKICSMLSDNLKKDLYKHAIIDSPGKFKIFLKKIKIKYGTGRLGQPLDKRKHLKSLAELVKSFQLFYLNICKAIGQKDSQARGLLRVEIIPDEAKYFSNMCLSLTTKENYRLYKNNRPIDPKSSNQQFNYLYKEMVKLFKSQNDIPRARLRRLISAEALADMSDIISSLQSESDVENYRERKNISFSI